MLPFCKHVLFFIFLSTLANITFGQKTELKVNVYSGLFSFRGNGSASSSPVNISDAPQYWNFKPYGRKAGLSYSFEFQVQRVTQQNHVFGLGISWEELKSKASIDTIRCGFCVPGHSIDVTKGKETVATSFLTFNPFVGQRFNAGRIKLEAVAGVDLSICTRVQEIAKFAALQSDKYTIIEQNKRQPFGDIRPRVQLSAIYDRISISTGYSLGLVNFQHTDNRPYLPTTVYTNFLRLGIGYKLY